MGSRGLTSNTPANVGVVARVVGADTLQSNAGSPISPFFIVFIRSRADNFRAFDLPFLCAFPLSSFSCEKVGSSGRVEAIRADTPTQPDDTPDKFTLCAENFLGMLAVTIASTPESPSGFTISASNFRRSFEDGWHVT
jgi:hypothetical protein